MFRIQHFRLNTNPDPGFHYQNPDRDRDPKHCKILKRSVTVVVWLSGLFLPQALVHGGDPDPARPVSAQSHLESPQVLGHRAPRREGSQLCRQVHRSLGSAFRISLWFWHGSSVAAPDPGSNAFWHLDPVLFWRLDSDPGRFFSGSFILDPQPIFLKSLVIIYG